MRFLLFVLHSSFFILLLFGCAQIVKPTGGPKDTIPPKAISFEPGNKSVNFKSKKIVIRFNKYIQLKDIQSQLVISPPLKTFPKVKISGGKAIEVEIKDTLHDSTTYTFNFGSSIADITENNPVPNFRYVFSTGSYLDSLNLSGIITDGYNLKPQKDAIIMLYADKSDSAPYKKLPYYYARSDDKGVYHIENVKEGSYKVISLSKGGTDYFYHPYTEGIGFLGKPIEIKKNKDSVNLSLFTEEDPKLKLLKAKATEPNKIVMVFNNASDSLAVRPLNLPTDTITYTTLQYSVTRDTVNYWLYTPRLDSIKFIVSKNKKVVDTATIYSFPVPMFSRKNAKALPLMLQENVHDNQRDFDYHQPIVIQSPAPLKKINRAKIRLMKRKDTIHFTTDPGSLPFSLGLKADLQSDSTYMLLLAPGAFTDYSGKESDSLLIHFTPASSTYFGSLKLTLKVPKQVPYIVQLLNQQNNVVRQNTIKDSAVFSIGGSKGITLNYEALAPLTYTVRIIEDANSDGKWTTGNYLKNIQPEKIYYYPQPITIRSNWDIVQEWRVK